MQIYTDKDKGDKTESKNGQPGLGIGSVESEIDEAEQCSANLQGVLFKKLDIPEEEEEEDEADLEEKSENDKESAMGGMTGEDSNMEGDEKSQVDGEQAGLEKKKKRAKMRMNWRNRQSKKMMIKWTMKVWKENKLKNPLMICPSSKLWIS